MPEVSDANIRVGAQVTKLNGYPYPGEVRSLFTTRAGQVRCVVEATGNEYAGMLHIFNPEQLAASPSPSQQEAAKSLSVRVKELEEVLRPFSDMAGEMFSRGWDASNVALALDNPDDPHRVTAGDFFRARSTLEAIR